MERRLARINSSTAGGTAGTGAKTHKVTLPSRWLQAMGITDENRQVELTFDGQQIVITKVVTIEEFYDEKKAQSHCVKTLKFWNGDICFVRQSWQILRITPSAQRTIPVSW